MRYVSAHPSLCREIVAGRFFLSLLAHIRRSGHERAFHAGVYAEPAFAIAFKDAVYGFATMQAKNKQLAFMAGSQDKLLQIKGNPALVIWF